VLLPLDASLLGTSCVVRITRAEKFCVFADVLSVMRRAVAERARARALGLRRGLFGLFALSAYIVGLHPSIAAVLGLLAGYVSSTARCT
jgi:hypothetical protein